MGAAGSDAALETADVALMADELLKIPYAFRLSRATVRNIRMNLAISLVLKAAFVVAAVAGVATLWMAVARRHRRVGDRDRQRAAAAAGRLRLRASIPRAVVHLGVLGSRLAGACFGFDSHTFATRKPVDRHRRASCGLRRRSCRRRARGGRGGRARSRRSSCRCLRRCAGRTAALTSLTSARPSMSADPSGARRDPRLRARSRPGSRRRCAPSATRT